METQVQPGVQAQGCQAGQRTGRGAGGSRSGPARERVAQMGARVVCRPAAGPSRPWADEAEQLEIEKLFRDVAKLTAERDTPKERRPTSPGTRYEVCLCCEAPRDLAGLVDLLGTRRVSLGLPCLAQPFAKWTGSV